MMWEPAPDRYAPMWLARELSTIERALIMTSAPLRAGDHYRQVIEGLMGKGVLKVVYPIETGTLIPLTDFGWRVRSALRHIMRPPPPQEGGE